MRYRGASWGSWQQWPICMLGLLAPAVALYLLTAAWPDTPDGLFHLHRVRALAEALRWGVLYPRWFPDFAFGYGYPVLNFYAPLFYYPPAFLHLAGLDLIAAVRLSLAAWYALSGLAAHALLRRWVQPLPAALGAILYLVFPYRLYDLFVRGALPEFAAFLWLPLIVWATVRWAEPAPTNPPGALCPTSNRKWWIVILKTKPMALILAALGWTGLILTHNLTALMAALVGLGTALTWTLVALLRKAESSHKLSVLARVWGWGLPLALAALLSGPYVLPALLETAWVGLGATPETRGYAAHFVGLGNLFDFSMLYPYPAAAQPTVPMPGYSALLLFLAAGAMLLQIAKGRRAGLGASIGIALAALWLNTSSSAFVWDGLAPVLGKLQFPWRWQAIAALAMAAALAWTLEIAGRSLATHGRLTLTRPLAPGFTLALAIYLMLNAFGGLHPAPAPFAAADLTLDQMWDFDVQHGQVGASWAGEFLPRWVMEQRWAIGREPGSGTIPSQPAQTIQSIQVRAQGYLGERLRYTASAPGRLVYHAFFYPAWRVEVDGQAQPAYPLGELGLLAVDLPAGEHEAVRRWSATPAVWAGRATAALGWLAVLSLFAAQRTGRRPLYLGLWLIVAGLGVVGSSGWLAREQIATPIGANYGSVRLEAAVVTPARADGTAQVMLYWLVTGTPEPLTAFVHVLAPDGRMVAGHDAPLAGLYSPASRWQMGQLLPDRHVVRLPVGLPAGTYQLKAGLYRPAAPDRPLMPAGSNPADLRVIVGTLEVRP